MVCFSLYLTYDLLISDCRLAIWTARSPRIGSRKMAIGNQNIVPEFIK